MVGSGPERASTGSDGVEAMIGGIGKETRYKGGIGTGLGGETNGLVKLIFGNCCNSRVLGVQHLDGLNNGLHVVFLNRVYEGKTTTLFRRKDVVRCCTGREGADGFDGLRELGAVGLEGFGGWVSGAEGIGEAGLDKCTDGIQLLPWGEEGLFNLFKFAVQVVYKVLEVGDVGNKADGDSKVAVVVLTLKGWDRFGLDLELV